MLKGDVFDLRGLSDKGSALVCGVTVSLPAPTVSRSHKLRMYRGERHMVNDRRLQEVMVLAFQGTDTFIEYGVLI